MQRVEFVGVVALLVAACTTQSSAGAAASDAATPDGADRASASCVRSPSLDSFCFNGMVGYACTRDAGDVPAACNGTPTIFQGGDKTAFCCPP
jgi:hypothetical protein